MNTISRAPRTPAAPTNGSPPEILPEHRQQQVAAGLATYQKVLAERDELDARLSEALKLNAALNTQLDAIKGVVNMMESAYNSGRIEMEQRIATFQRERDEAVRVAAKKDAVIENIFAIAHASISERPDEAS